MIHRLAAASCVAFLTACFVWAGDGDKCELKEQYRAGDICTVKAQTDMAMDIELTGAHGERKLPVKFSSRHEYVEKIIETGEDGRPSKVARRFEKSTQDTEKPDGTKHSGPTSFDRKTYIIEKTDKGVKAAQAGGGEVSEQEEKELGTAVLGNLHRVLPGKEVEVGDTWDVPLETVREIHSINTEIKGTAKATFTGVEELGERKVAVVKLEIDVEVPQGAMTMSYKGVGKAYFALEEKRIVCIDSTALISVSGSQKMPSGEIKFGGGGSSRSSYRVSPGKGEIDLTPPDDSKENGKDENEGSSGEGEEK